MDKTCECGKTFQRPSGLKTHQENKTCHIYNEKLSQAKKLKLDPVIKLARKEEASAIVEKLPACSYIK